MFVSELFANDGRQVLVIYPGRFQPFHKGHAAVYNHLCQKYGADNVFICTSNKVESPKSPFSFDDKKKMMVLTGVDVKHIIYDPQPYQAKSFVDKVDPHNTTLLFAVSEKDMAEDPRFQFKPKKDGSPSYFQPLQDLNKCKSLDKHAYITTVPTFNFKVLGKPANSATQIREQFANANEATQKKIVTDLFGKFDPAVLKIMQRKLTAVTENLRESVEDDSQIHKIQEKYDVTWQEAARMYHIDKVRVKDEKKEPPKKIDETIIHTTRYNNFLIDVDDHYLERAKQRKVGHAETGRAIAKFPKINHELREINPGQQFWVFDAKQNIGLGMRKNSNNAGSMHMILKTIIRGSPSENGRTPIVKLL